MDLNKKRLPQSYPRDIVEAANLIAFNPDKLIYYGSQAKKPMYLSSGDIDLLEPVNLSKAGELAKKFYQIILNIDAKELCYLADVKSGVDSYYVTDIGKISDGKVVGLDKDSVKSFIKSRDFDNKKEMLELLEGPMHARKYFALEDLMRKKQILRWGRDELLRGYKVIRGQKVMLEDTIKDKDSMTKIDTIQFVPSMNRFVEITNYFFVSNKTKEFDELAYIADLKLNIFKCYCEGKYFKLCKRLLTYMLLKKRNSDALSIFRVVHSGLGIVYQCKSELDAILYLLENYASSAPIQHIIQQLDEMKYRLGSVYEFEFEEEALYKTIDKLIEAKSEDKLIKGVAELSGALGEMINNHTVTALKKADFLPLPKDYVP